MEYAIFRVCGYSPTVLMTDELPVSTEWKSRRATILKLHGDYLFGNIRNLGHELWATKESMARKLAMLSEAGPLIVAGYSGGDTSVMETLGQLASNPSTFRGGMFWLNLGGTAPNPSVARLLEATGDRGSGIVETEGADAFFSDLGTDLASLSGSKIQHLPDRPHLAPMTGEARERIGRFWLGLADYAAFSAQLRNRPEFFAFSETAAGFDALLAAFEEKGELPSNVGAFTDRYLDILIGGLLPPSPETTRRKSADRQDALISLGFSKPGGASIGLHGSTFESYISALDLTEAAAPRERFSPC